MSALTTSPTRELAVFVILALSILIGDLLGHDPAPVIDDDCCPKCGGETAVYEDDEGHLACSWCAWSRPLDGVTE